MSFYCYVILLSWYSIVMTPYCHCWKGWILFYRISKHYKKLHFYLLFLIVVFLVVMIVFLVVFVFMSQQMFDIWRDLNCIFGDKISVLNQSQQRYNNVHKTVTGFSICYRAATILGRNSPTGYCFWKTLVKKWLHNNNSLYNNSLFVSLSEEYMGVSQHHDSIT